MDSSLEAFYVPRVAWSRSSLVEGNLSNVWDLARLFQAFLENHGWLLFWSRRSRSFFPGRENFE